MGLEYSLVKTDKPEAYDIGKDYYGLTDLFPCTAGKAHGIRGLIPVPKLKDLPHIVGSRHWFVDSTVFRITSYYQNAEEMIAKAETLKQRQLEDHERQMFKAFYTWAGDDPLQIITDFAYLEGRDAAGEYQLCAPPSQYRIME